jgi:hypothetical protein
MRRITNFAMALALTCLGMAGIASASNDRSYTAAVSPSDVAPSTTVNYNLSVTNSILSTAPSHFIQQVIVTVPSAFTITGPATVQVPASAPAPWVVIVSGHTITATASTSDKKGTSTDYSVTSGQGITITVPAKAPALLHSCPDSDSYTWGITANQTIGGGNGSTYQLAPGTSNPVVKVSCDTFTNLSLAISPDSLASTDTSALLTLTATLNKVAGGAAVNGESITFSVGGAAVTCQVPAVTVNGVATCSYYPLPNTNLPGGFAYDCQASFAGDGALGLGSSTSNTVKLSINSTGTGLSVSPATGAYGGTADLSAILTANGSPLVSKTVNFFLGSTSVGSGITNGAGVATVPGVSLAGIAPGVTNGLVIAKFAGDGTYSAADGAATMTVGLIQPTITWTNPADIPYGTQLSGTQLNATATYSGATVDGTFTYSPAAGTLLNAGHSQTLSATFTPNDPLTYTTATATVLINVLTASQVTPVAVTGPSSMTFGATGNAAASGGNGTGAYIFSAGGSTGCSLSGNTVSVIDATLPCSLTVTKAADNNYNSATSAPFTVTLNKATQAALTVTAPGGVAYKTTGTATASGGSGTGALSFNAGSSTGCSVSGTTVSVINPALLCSLTATKAADNNYNSATSAPFSVTLNKANQATVMVTGPGSVTYGTTGTASALGGSGSGAYSFNATGSTGCSVTGKTVSVSNAGGTCILTATKAGDVNYNASSVSAPFTVKLK